MNMDLLEYQKKYQMEKHLIVEFEIKRAKFVELRQRFEELKSAGYKMKQKDYLLMRRLEKELQFLKTKITVYKVEI